MDLFTILGSALRRFYVTLPIVALAAYLAWQSYLAVEPVYSSSVSVTVLPPVTPPPVIDPETGEEIEPYESNPYDGPSLAAAVLARNLNSSSFAERMGFDDTERTLEADTDSDDPILEIIATAETPRAVLTLLRDVTAEANVVLRDFQAEAGATEGSRYRLAPAVPAETVEDVTPSRFRTAGAIGVIGMAVAAAAATGVDVALERRAARVRARRANDPPPTDEETASDTADGGDTTQTPGTVEAPAGPAPADDAPTDDAPTDNAPRDDAARDDAPKDDVTVPDRPALDDAATNRGPAHAR
ncbi:hypothetical protein [Georgenia alba]|uniref:Capsular polysaccharide biosynthesis protein n=1 Tax=Georgenia alba TaxID=2233858 RepID=A0ABW2Q5T9_9MICO